MKVTVIKTFEGREAVKAEQVVVTLEDLIIFTQKLGYVQSLEDYLQDFRNFRDVTYRTEVVNEYQ